MEHRNEDYSIEREFRRLVVVAPAFRCISEKGCETSIISTSFGGDVGWLLVVPMILSVSESSSLWLSSVDGIA